MLLTVLSGLVELRRRLKSYLLQVVFLVLGCFHANFKNLALILAQWPIATIKNDHN